MTVGIAFTFCSFFFIALLTVVYFCKPRLKLIENKIYSWIILTSLFGTIIGLPCYYFMVDYESTPLPNFIFSRLYLIYLITWIMLFTLYVIVISFPKINIRKMNFYFLISYIILVLLAIILPLYYHTGIVYSYGPATQYITVVSCIFIIIMLYCLFKNIKQIREKKYLPLIFFILFGSVILTIQRLNPGLLLITFGEAFITFLMYFTIENPDVKIIEELNKNRLLINQITEEKSNFTFSISSQLKGPILNIERLSKIDNDENIDFKERMMEINNNANTLSFLANSIMDISTLTNGNIKVVNNKYNLRNLVEKIRLVKEKELNPDVEFRININKIIPEYLYGDSELLEQVLLSLLDNAIKYTNKGFVELTINAIVKYDMCRLVITVADSGSGISIDKVNELLLIDEPLNDKDLKRLETKNVDINIIKKIVNKLGGFFTIKSEKNKGTEIKFVIDVKTIKDSNDFDKYINKNTILVASNDINFLNNITKSLSKKGFDVETSIYGNDVMDRIRIGQEFSYIFLDDMLDIRALELLKKLKKNPKFKTPVIVMLDDNTAFIKEHFIEDGFNDYLIKSNLGEDIARIFK